MSEFQKLAMKVFFVGLPALLSGVLFTLMADIVVGSIVAASFIGLGLTWNKREPKWNIFLYF